MGHSKEVESSWVSVWYPTSQKLRGNWSSDFLTRVTAAELGPQCWLPASQPCAFSCPRGCDPPEGECCLEECAGWADEPHVSRHVVDWHPSLEMAVSATRQPQRLGHGGRLGFMPGNVILHLARSKPAHLFWPRLHHRSVLSESPLRLPLPIGSVFQVIQGESMRSKCHLPSLDALPGKEDSEAVLCV